MITDDLQKKIRHIEIFTKRLLSGSMVGDSRSAIKGSGFEFDQIREYRMGDDVRGIDWKSTARTGNILVKQYFEERDRTIVLAVDISASSFFTSLSTRKLDNFQKIAAVLALVAEYGKDNVSLFLFSDEIELFLPPGKGRAHVYSILKQIFSCNPQKRKTSITVVLKRLAALKQRDAVVFLISDFIDDWDEALLAVVARLHDLIAIRSLDQHELCLPSVGFLPVQDIETGEEVTLDTRGKSKWYFKRYLDERIAYQKKIFRKYGIDCLELADHKLLIADIIQFFRRRTMY